RWGSANRTYPGALEITVAGRGLRLANEAPLEDYVRGVMSAETPSTFHPAALKAMAVATRTYAARCSGRHSAGVDLCDTTHCQVYPGIGRVPKSIDAAVAATTGIYTLY